MRFGTDEERRLFYVGITRARVGLSLGKTPLRGRQSVDVEPSRFMLDITLSINPQTVASKGLKWKGMRQNAALQLKGAFSEK